MKDLSFGDTHRTFAEKVIDILKAENIKFTTLAKEVGENVSTIKNCLYGRRRIKKDIAEKICDYLKSLIVYSYFLALLILVFQL